MRLILHGLCLCDAGTMDQDLILQARCKDGDRVLDVASGILCAGMTLWLWHSWYSFFCSRWQSVCTRGFERSAPLPNMGRDPPCKPSSPGRLSRPLAPLIPSLRKTATMFRPSRPAASWSGCSWFHGPAAIGTRTYRAARRVDVGMSQASLGRPAVNQENLGLDSVVAVIAMPSQIARQIGGVPSCISLDNRVHCRFSYR